MMPDAARLILGQPVPVLTRAAFLEQGPAAIMRRDTPCVIDWYGADEAQAAFDRIRSGLGGEQVTLFCKPADIATRQRSRVTSIPLGEFLDNPGYRARDGKTLYRVVTNIAKNPGLVDDVLGMPAAPLFPYRRPGNRVNVWINFKGQFGRLHFDEMENFNLQLAGAKRFICLPPGWRRYSTRPVLKGFGHHSAFPDVTRLDLTAYPAMAAELPKARECVLRPGQMLYLPTAWWHQVDPLGEDANVNMNFWLYTPKVLRHPYVLFDALYKDAFRRFMKLYDYRPAARSRPAPQPQPGASDAP
ncbi:cupin-like domain-containing protein [Niveispirillum fermenti]|uniref:cupin-like domain-containing protein n=1 Tax=Niveispirillum fermenti TaxID=1233113 RepID=UPI003A8AD530